MAILGSDGNLKLKRENPLPTTVTPANVNIPTNSYQLSVSDVWSGDQVQLTAPGGLPFLQTATQTGNPGGQGIWSGTPWTYAEGYQSIGSGDAFWNLAPAFPWADAQPVVPSLTAYVYVDQLGRARFYTTRAAAVNGDPSGALQIGSTNFVEMTITTLDGDWRYTCDLESWTLELDAPSVDTTAIGVKFGEAVKSLVTGGGEIGYLVDRRAGSGIDDPTSLFRLLLLTERGCKALAQFWMIEDRLSTNCANISPGDLYYETEMLVVGTSINTRAEDLIGGAARFVTTGEIRLKVGV